MFHYKRCLAWVLIPALLVTILSGCPRLRDIGAAILAEPQSLTFGTETNTLVLSLAKNASATGQGPIVIVPTASWLLIDDCATAADNCLSASPFDNVTVNVSVDRSRMELGENEATLIVYAGNSPVVEIPVKATDILKASFTATPRRVEIGEVIHFTNNSASTEASGPILSQEWNFGDGSSSSQATPPNKIYSAPGHYDIALTVRTATTEETLTQVAYVSVGDVRPLVDFSADRTVIAERQAVTFTDETTLSDRPDVDLADFVDSWRWDFGDGTTSTERSPAHQYASVGNYTVKLTVVTPFGEYSGTKENFIHVQRRLGPTADFFLPESPLPIRQPVQFTDLSDPGSDPITQWLWDFGDGTSGNVQDPQHTYTEAGTFDVKLTVTTAYGVSSKTRSITLQFQPPTADFEADDLTPAVGQAVQFTDLAVPGSDPIVSWTWDFGDGTTSTDREPLHTYTAATTEPLTVTLTVRSTASAPLNTATAVKTGYIMVFTPPAPAFDLALTEEFGRATDDNASVITDDPVTFVNQTVAGTEDQIGYFWEFGDETTSTETSPEHTYTEPGIYTVRLTASTETQLQRTQRLITVDAPPTPDFSATPRTVISGAEIQFNDLSVPGRVPVAGQAEPNTGTISAWLWDFGDGESADVQNPTHTYPLPEQYGVTLSIFFQHSGSGANLRASLSRDRYITILQPTDLVVNTLSDIVDGDTRSIAHLILDPGEDGLFSLREAIEATNSQTGAETIRFSVEGTISPNGDLPAITDEGTTILAEDKIVLDGANATTAGLTLQGVGAYISGLTIVNFPVAGVLLQGPSSMENTIRGCRIGNDGLVAVPNAIGVLIADGASGNFIGGAAANDRNIISGNFFQGVYIDESGVSESAGGNVIEGNYIGVDDTGLAALPNDMGIYIDESSANLIGGSSEGSRNVISGNTKDGIVITGTRSLSNAIYGNYIGTDANGTQALGNGGSGVGLQAGASLTRLGGSETGLGNIIAANGGSGVAVSGAESNQNRVAGNNIGVDVTSKTALGNIAAGVILYGGTTGNLIGFSEVNGGNIIGGNGDAGVVLEGAGVSGNQVANNAIGTVPGEAAGGVPGAVSNKQVTLLDVGNLMEGVRLADGAAANIIGGDGESEGNLIRYNAGDGVRIANVDSDENLIQGNAIILNEGSGVDVRDGATRARIGRVLASFSDAAANIIRANQIYGVAVWGPDSLAVSIRANQVTRNVEGPIFLGDGANMGVEAPYILGFDPLNGMAPPFAIVDVFVDTDDSDLTVLPHYLYVGSTNARLTGEFRDPALGNTLTTIHGGRNAYVTATDAFGNTSQYSDPIPIPVPAP